MAGTRPAGQARGRAAEQVLLLIFVGALTIGLLLCLNQPSVNAQARQCPADQVFCFGKCVDTSSDQANCGGAEYCAEMAKCVGTAYALPLLPFLPPGRFRLLKADSFFDPQARQGSMAAFAKIWRRQ
jgi:hypothetical protein